MQSLLVDRYVRQLNLELLPLQPLNPKAGEKKEDKEKEDVSLYRIKMISS